MNERLIGRTTGEGLAVVAWRVATAAAEIAQIWASLRGTLAAVSALVAISFGLIAFGVVGTFVVGDRETVHGVMILGWVVLMIDWQRRRRRGTTDDFR